MNADLSSLAGTLARLGAPILGTVIGGPVGTLAGAAITALADALGTKPTPEAVAEAAEKNPAIVQRVEVEQAPSMVAELQARLADVQDARAQTLQLAGQNSLISWGAPTVSVIVLVGFVVLSLLAMKPSLAGTNENVTLYLLGAWQSLVVGVVNYWVGSSAGSKQSGDAVRALAQTATASNAVAAARR